MGQCNRVRTVSARCQLYICSSQTSQAGLCARAPTPIDCCRQVHQSRALLRHVHPRSTSSSPGVLTARMAARVALAHRGPWITMGAATWAFRTRKQTCRRRTARGGAARMDFGRRPPPTPAQCTRSTSPGPRRRRPAARKTGSHSQASCQTPSQIRVRPSRAGMPSRARMPQ